MIEKYRILLLIVGCVILLGLATLGWIIYFNPKPNYPPEVKEMLEEKITPVNGKIIFFAKRADEYGTFLLQKGKIKYIGSGKQIFCSNGKKLFSKGIKAFYISNLNDEIEKEISIPDNYNPYSFDISPDGSLIVFSSNMGEDIYNLYTIDINGENLKQITSFPKMDWFPNHPKFSPDGKQIAFQAEKYMNNPKSPATIYIINNDGAELRELFNGKFEGAIEPAWSPDGKEIVFIGSFEIEGDRYRNVCIADANTGNFRRITKHKFYDHHPCFSPDGRQIVYSSARLGDTILGANLFAVNTDGTDEIRLTPLTRIKRFPYWATDESPDWKD